MNPLILVGAAASILVIFAARKKKQKELPPAPPTGPIPPKSEHPSDSDLGPHDFDPSLDEDPPPEFGADDIWVSENCGGFAVGAEYVPRASVGGRMIDAAEAYALAVTTPQAPDESVFPEETPIRRFTRAAMSAANEGWASEGYVICDEKTAPWADDYAADEWETFLKDLEIFEEQSPGLAAALDAIEELANDPMWAAYEARFPEAWQRRFENDWALRSMEQTQLNLEDKSDWAYHQAYPEPSCPFRIDVSNPEHDACKAAWLRIQGYIINAGG